jgi:predicted esterase
MSLEGGLPLRVASRGGRDRLQRVTTRATRWLASASWLSALGQAAVPWLSLTLAACAAHSAPAKRVQVGANEPPAAAASAVPEQTPPGRASDHGATEPAATGSEAAAQHDAEGFELVALPVPGFLDAVLALPTEKRAKPLAIATHGAGGGPEWPCDAWARRLAGERIVLCPRGKAISQRENYGFYYPDHRALEAELLAAVAASKAALGARLADGPVLYTGYSQGAAMGSLALADHGGDYPYLILTEGGFKEWSAQSARRFKQSGGQRVLFVCGGRGCRDQALKSARILDAAGIGTRVEYVAHGGHTDDGAVGERLDATFRWALEGGETSKP